LYFPNNRGIKGEFTALPYIGVGLAKYAKKCYTRIAGGGMMLAIRLPIDIETRLAKLAKATGRTKTYYATQAILEKIEDLEDYYLAEKAYGDFVANGDKAISLEDVKREYEASH
jgi:RHH-type rel operon transcriptional repressor/antitoxin RelB